MKKKYFLCFCFYIGLAFIFMGCAGGVDEQSPLEELNPIQNNTDSRPISKEEKLREYGLPLQGENVFDPTQIRIGDRVQGLVLKSIQVHEGTDDYPHDTVQAVFEGKVKLMGSIEFIKKDNEINFQDYLLFTPDAESLKRLPISHHESPNRAMVFENHKEAIARFGLTPGEKRENISIEIDEFTINYLPTDAQNTAKLLEIIE